MVEYLYTDFTLPVIKSKVISQVVCPLNFYVSGCLQVDSSQLAPDGLTFSPTQLEHLKLLFWECIYDKRIKRFVALPASHGPQR